MPPPGGTAAGLAKSPIICAWIHKIWEELCQAPWLSLPSPNRGKSPLRQWDRYSEMRSFQASVNTRWRLPSFGRITVSTIQYCFNTAVYQTKDNSAGPRRCERGDRVTVTLSPLLELHQTSGCYSQPSARRFIVLSFWKKFCRVLRTRSGVVSWTCISLVCSAKPSPNANKVCGFLKSRSLERKSYSRQCVQQLPPSQ